MASLTKFTLSPSGDLVYKSTGKLAPSNYTFRKNTVYKTGADGVKRRVGSLSRKLTKTQAAKIAKAERSRFKRTGQPQKPRQPSKGTVKKAATKSLFAEYGEDGWDDGFDSSEFPEATQAIKEEFAQRVRAAAVSVAPESLKAKIERLSTEALWKAYVEDAYIFEMYFKYHDPFSAPHRSDASVWLYQFVYRIEQYMGVTE